MTQDSCHTPIALHDVYLASLIRALAVIILRPRLALRHSEVAPPHLNLRRRFWCELVNSPTAPQRPDRGGWYESIISAPFIAGRRRSSQNIVNWLSNRGANWLSRHRRPGAGQTYGL